MSLLGRLIGAGVRGAVDAEREARDRDPARWLLTRGIVLVVLLVGWVFIAWQNKFHITAPVFFVCVGYLAVVMTVVNLWRTGAAAMAPDQAGEEAWSRPIGERGELEKEKRTLLKAIKESEFDHQMGKLSKADADALIQTYRARAIEVIKELERFENVGMEVDPAGRPLGRATVREQIAREVKARLELASAAKPKKKRPADKGDGKPVDATPEVKAEVKTDAKAEVKTDAKTEAKTEAAPAPKAEEAPTPEVTVEAKDDEAGASEATS